MQAQGKIRIIGELINHSFARARRAWESKDIAGYQNLARLQEQKGASYLTVNLDGTQMLQIDQSEMLAFLPDLIPALQEVTRLPLAFDNPSVKYHQVALAHYDAKRSPPPMLNSLAASREDLDAFYELIGQYKPDVILMASEGFKEDGGYGPNFDAEEVLTVSRHFAERLNRAGVSNDKIFIDPGLAPVAADTYGLVHMSLEGIRKIRACDDLRGVHTSVGLTNFSFGVPAQIRHHLENAYITIAEPLGLDTILASPEKEWKFLDAADPVLMKLKEALEVGRPRDDMSREETGMEQAAKIMELYRKGRG